MSYNEFMRNVILKQVAKESPATRERFNDEQILALVSCYGIHAVIDIGNMWAQEVKE